MRTMELRRAGATIAAALAATVLAGCTVPAPEGQAPLRYRDQVFSAVSRTNDLTYGQAPDLQGNPVDLKLDLFQPAGDTVTKRPAYVWVHGGGFSHGDKARARGWRASSRSWGTSRSRSTTGSWRRPAAAGSRIRALSAERPRPRRSTTRRRRCGG